MTQPPAINDAVARYEAAIAGAYSALLARKLTRDEALRLALACGATVVRDDELSIALVDPSASLALTLQWDPDHECWYGSAKFAP